MVNDLSATCCSLMPLWIPRAGVLCDDRSLPVPRHSLFPLSADGTAHRAWRTCTHVLDVRASRPCRLDNRPLHPIPLYCARRVACLRDAHRVLHNDVTLRHERLQRHMVPACPVRRHDEAPLSCNSLAPSLASHPH